MLLVLFTSQSHIPFVNVFNTIIGKSVAVFREIALGGVKFARMALPGYAALRYEIRILE